MSYFVDSFEEIYNQLSGIGSEVSEEAQVAMFLASFGDKNESQYGQGISVLQTVPYSLTWETVTSRFWQEFDEHKWQKKVQSNLDSTQERHAPHHAKESKDMRIGKGNGPPCTNK